MDFPFAQYTSVLSTHTVLLVFTALFLPRSTLLVASLPPQQSSLDKPQHPFLVPITASPVWSVLWLCAGAVICQAWWAGWMRMWLQTGSDPSRVADRKLQALRDAWANTLIASVLFHVIVVLFGAPIASHVPHTYLLSLLVSVLAVFAPSYTLSLPLLSFSLPVTEARWRTLFIEQKLSVPIDRALVYPSLGSILGSWAGAFPIPLDWDRPWQAWPLTPAYGALAGHIVGAWIAASINVVLFFASKGRELQNLPAPARSTPSVKKKRTTKRE